jgi:VWFA-related protein
MHRWFSLLLISMPLLVPAQNSPVTLRTNSSEVLVDFTARDKHGNIVRDLKPDEVQVFENGIPQRKRHFEFFDGRRVSQEAGLTPEPEASATAVVRPGPSVNELRQASVVSVVIADLDPRGRKLTQDVMREFVKDQLDPNTYVGVFSLDEGGLLALQPYTNDAAKIAAAVQRAVRAVPFRLSSSKGLGAGSAGGGLFAIQGSGPSTPGAPDGMAADFASIVGQAWANEQEDVYQESIWFLSPLRMLIQAQKAIPGRKVLLLFAGGLPVQSDTVSVLRGIISVANRANVTVYAEDTGGYTSASDLNDSRRLLGAAANASMQQQMAGVTGSQEVLTPAVIAPELGESAIHANQRGNLEELADGTGGELLPDSLDLRDPLRRAMEDARMHYELNYAPTDPATDGSFRRIEVKVSRPGVTVFARSGYFAVPLVNGREVYPFEMATLQAINTTPLPHQFGFHAQALRFRPGPAEQQLAFVFEVPTRNLDVVKDGPWAKVHVDVTALVRDERGQVVRKISKEIAYDVPAARQDELERGTVSFAAPFDLSPGSYTLETAAVDRQAMKASVTRESLVVNSGEGFAMSDVAVIRRVDPWKATEERVDPLEARGAKLTPEIGTLQRKAGGKVQIYAVAYPPAPLNGTVKASLEILRDGQVLAQTPQSDVTPDATGAASILASMPMDVFPAGNYEAEVSFEYNGKSLTRRTAFTMAAE